MTLPTMLSGPPSSPIQAQRWLPARNASGTAIPPFAPCAVIGVETTNGQTVLKVGACSVAAGATAICFNGAAVIPATTGQGSVTFDMPTLGYYVAGDGTPAVGDYLQAKTSAYGLTKTAGQDLSRRFQVLGGPFTLGDTGDITAVLVDGEADKLRGFTRYLYTAGMPPTDHGAIGTSDADWTGWTGTYPAAAAGPCVEDHANGFKVLVAGRYFVSYSAAIIWDGSITVSDGASVNGAITIPVALAINGTRVQQTNRWAGGYYNASAFYAASTSGGAVTTHMTPADGVGGYGQVGAGTWLDLAANDIVSARGYYYTSGSGVTVNNCGYYLPLLSVLF